VVNQSLEEGIMPNQTTQHRNTRHKGLTLAMLVCITSAMADYQINKSTINSGGQSSEQAVMKSNRFSVKSSIGQSDAGPTQQGGTYQLQGGFWQQNTDLIFKHSLD
jgi:hypothetical protein